MNEAKQQVDEFQRATLADYLEKLTDEQRAFFKRLYPNGPRPDQMTWAIQQCINTLKKNEK